MVKTIKEHLEDTFEDLGEEKLRRFKIKLRDRKPDNDKLVVRQATIDKIKDAVDLADVMWLQFPSASSKAQSFIDGNGTELINRVYSVDPILDELRQKKVITDEDYNEIRAEIPHKQSMRPLLHIIISVGSMGKYLLYEALKKSNGMLMQDLEAGRL